MAAEDVRWKHGNFERLKRLNTAMVIPVVGDKILVQEQQQPDMEPFVGLAGGRCNDYEEDQLTIAKRELLEETGHVSQDCSSGTL